MAAVLSKVCAESLLSLYPVFVKNINAPTLAQMWTRFAAYVAVSLPFVDFGFVWKQVRSKWGLALAAMTLAHIYTSYVGFQNMSSGNSFTLFYIYPILILLFSGKLSVFLGALAVGAVALLSRGESAYGAAMVGLAALTEALIYFIVLKIPSPNSWNHIFLSYFAGAFLLSFLNTGPIADLSTTTLLGLGGNAVLGLGGYYLRFYSMSRLPVVQYALLSNVGIVMSYVYGYGFNGEIPTVGQMVGALAIMAACYLAKK
jgi:drug/metabolite transporter (DMT)-like permease